MIILNFKFCSSIFYLCLYKQFVVLINKRTPIFQIYNLLQVVGSEQYQKKLEPVHFSTNMADKLITNLQQNQQ